MIFVSHALPVNVPDEPRLGRQQVWDGLVLKANNALPFVPAMTYCEVTRRHSDTVFDRDIDFRGQRFTERITLEAPYRVTFTRIAGPVLGTIANEIAICWHRRRPGPAVQLRLGRRGRGRRVGRGAGVRRLDDRGLPPGRRGHAERDAPPRRGRGRQLTALPPAPGN